MSRRAVDIKLTVTGPDVIPGALSPEGLEGVAGLLRGMAKTNPVLKNVACVGIKATKRGTTIEILVLPTGEAAP
jgi:hypothetical protein